LIGPNKRKRDNLLIPMTIGMQPLKTKDELLVEKVFESCAFKTTLSCIMGFGLGGAIGLFSASVGPEAMPNETQTVRQVLREMKVKTLSYAKNFAILGAMFAANECTIESVCIDWLLGLNKYLRVLTGCVFIFGTVVQGED